MKQILISVVISLLPVTLLAQNQTSYQCTMGELTRRVEIMHETGVAVPCEVHYYKDTEAPGDVQVLWRAISEEGYCEAKTKDFVAKLSTMGWECGMPAGKDDSEPAMNDDSDTLAPAEDIELPESDEEPR
jgi:hypothetical protein